MKKKTGFSFVHVSDLHLGASFRFLNEKAAERRADLREVLTRIVDEVLRKTPAVKIAFLTGDLFDKYNPEPDDRSHAFKELERMAQQGIRVYVLPGTHDFISHRLSVWNQPFDRNIIIVKRSSYGRVDSCEIEGRRVAVFSMAWDPGMPSYTLEPGEIAEDEIAFGMLHASWMQGVKWKAAPKEILLDDNKIRDLNLDYLALGHFHGFKKKKIGRTLAAYPGSPEGLKFDETGDRYIIFGKVGEDDGITIEKSAVNIRTIKTLEIDLTKTGIDSAEELASRIRRKSGENVICKVAIQGAPFIEYNCTELEERLKPEFFWLTVDDNTKPGSSDWIETIARENTIRGLFAEKLLARIKDEPENKILSDALKIGIEYFQSE